MNAYATIQAESYSARSAQPKSETTTDVGGGLDMGYIGNADYLQYNNVDFGSTSATQVIARIASGGGITGQAEVHLDSLTNPAIGALAIADTGGWQTWQTVSATIGATTGRHTVFLKFTTAAPSSQFLVNVNWFYFSVTALTTPTPTLTPTPAPTSSTVVSAYATIQAESFAAKSTQPKSETTSDVGGGLDMGFFSNADWLRFDNVDFGSTPARQVFIRLASGASITGLIEVHLDSLTNPTLGSVAAASTGGWQLWQTTSATITSTTGNHTVFLKFTTTAPSYLYLVNVNWFYFGH